MHAYIHTYIHAHIQLVPAANNLVGMPGLIPEQDLASGGAHYTSKFQRTDGGVLSTRKSLGGVIEEGMYACCVYVEVCMCTCVCTSMMYVFRSMYALRNS